MDTPTVKMGEIYATDKPESISTFGIGSCIVVILYDDKNGIAGMAHAMLTEDKVSSTQISTHPLRFVRRAIEALLEKMQKLGANQKNIKAQIIGGAQMFSMYRETTTPIGVSNVAAAKEKLKELNISITKNSTGGTEGKNAIFDVSTCTVTIESRSTLAQDS